MKWTLILLACSSSVALAETSPWDATYQTDARGGSELCPDASASVVVSGGKFSIVWSFPGRKQLFRVGRIEGTIRESGFAVFKATLMDPMPSAVMAELGELSDSVEDLQKIAKEMKIELTSRSDQRSFDLTSGNCYARWIAPGGVPAAKPSAPPPTVAIKPAKPFKAPAPVAAGAAKWDSTYSSVMHFSSEWWCPKSDAFKAVSVKKGRFAIPWRVDATNNYGRALGEVVLGQLDGTIAASGSVTVRATLVDELPPEMAAHSMTAVKQLKPTIKFGTDSSGRQFHFEIGKNCEYEFHAKDYKISKPARSTSPPPRTSSPPPTTSSTPAKPPVDPNAPSEKRGYKALGAPCESDSACKSGICSGRMCSKRRSNTEKLPNGAECDGDYECASGLCDDDSDRCSSGDEDHKELPVGAKCKDDDECSSDDCDHGVCDD
jgi:hypothetical protein